MFFVANSARKYHWSRLQAVQTFSVPICSWNFSSEVKRCELGASADGSSSKMSLELCFNCNVMPDRELAWILVKVGHEKDWNSVSQWERRHRRFLIVNAIEADVLSSQAIFHWCFCSTWKRAQSNKSCFQIVLEMGFFFFSRLSSYRIRNILSCWGMLEKENGKFITWWRLESVLLPGCSPLSVSQLC